MISADGSVIAGTLTSRNGDVTRAVYWQIENSLPIVLEGLGGKGLDDDGTEVESVPCAISANGSVIAGYAANADGHIHAVYWKSGSIRPVDLGVLLSGNAESKAIGVSADGTTIIVEVSDINGSDENQHAFVYKIPAAH